MKKRLINFLLRSVAYAIDWILAIIITFSIYFVFFYLTKDFYPLKFESAIGILFSILISFIIIGGIMGIPITLHAWFLSRYEATPGKMLLKLKVVSLDNTCLTFWRAIGRTLALITISSSCTGGIGFIMALFEKESRTLHDIIAGTKVVKK